MEDKRSKPSFLAGLVVLLFVTTTVYFLIRGAFVFYARYGPFEKALAIIFFMSEAFILFHTFAYFANIYRLSVKEPDRPDSLPAKDFKSPPAVAILIPARHEPKSVLVDTLTGCYNLDYPNKKVYLLDDSSEEKYKKEAEEVARELNASIFRRSERHGAKAGIINDCLRTLTEKYVTVFDADQTPFSNFLSKLIPILEADPKLAFVQTPQFYSNLSSSRVSFAADMQQAIFYEYICEGKSSSQAMICCGTNVVLRREALMGVGGFDESTVTEDFATSIRLHIKGWRSRYYNHVYVFGMGPDNLGAYFKQQNRWAMGNVGVLSRVIGNFFRSPFALKPVQWLEYLVTSSYYLIGWAYLFLVICPMIYIFFSIPSFFMNPVIYTLTFMPYMVLSVAIFYISMSARRYNIPQLFLGQSLSFITLPVYMRASLFGLLGIKGTFQVTAKGGGKRISYKELWPQIVFWALSLAAITWGLNRFVYERTTSIIMNVAWVTFHFILFSGMFYFNETE